MNLQIDRSEDGTIKVSWDDPMIGLFEGVNRQRYGWWFLGGFAFCTFMAFAAAWWWFMLSLPLMLVTALVMNMTRMQRNSITFGRDRITHNGRTFDTARVTRFEYGLESHLTGVPPHRNANTGREDHDPMLIRLWLDDADTITISENNWQSQVVHKIRDTLDRALIEVRQEAVKIEREKTHGKTGDFGVPDY